MGPHPDTDLHGCIARNNTQVLQPTRGVSPGSIAMTSSKSKPRRNSPVVATATAANRPAPRRNNPAAATAAARQVPRRNNLAAAAAAGPAPQAVAAPAPAPVPLPRQAAAAVPASPQAAAPGPLPRPPSVNFDTRFDCQLCGKTFKGQLNFQKHGRLVHDKDPRVKAKAAAAQRKYKAKHPQKTQQNARRRRLFSAAIKTVAHYRKAMINAELRYLTTATMQLGFLQSHFNDGYGFKDVTVHNMALALFNYASPKETDPDVIAAYKEGKRELARVSNGEDPTGSGLDTETDPVDE